MIVSPDTSVLVEIFEGSQAGKVAFEALHCPCDISAAAVAEACSRAAKSGVATNKIVAACEELGAIIPLSATIAQHAGVLYTDIRSRRSKFGMVDAMILATAHVQKTTLLTFDNDFRGLPGVTVLKR